MLVWLGEPRKRRRIRGCIKVHAKCDLPGRDRGPDGSIAVSSVSFAGIATLLETVGAVGGVTVAWRRCDCAQPQAGRAYRRGCCGASQRRQTARIMCLSPRTCGWRAERIRPADWPRRGRGSARRVVRPFLPRQVTRVSRETSIAATPGHGEKRSQWLWALTCMTCSSSAPAMPAARLRLPRPGAARASAC